MMKTGLTLSVDTVTGRPFMAIRTVFWCGSEPCKGHCRSVPGAPCCILPEEHMGRICQVLVDKDIRGGVPFRWDWPQLLEVASELGNELRSISGTGQCCQKFAWNTQLFPVYGLRHGRLPVFFKGHAQSEEDEGVIFSPTPLRSAHCGSLE